MGQFNEDYFEGQAGDLPSDGTPDRERDVVHRSIAISLKRIGDTLAAMLDEFRTFVRSSDAGGAA